uniref:Uncharacterized protein n=1 Tax=Parascaris univalens TaxID=6257 RepID=A0A915BS36_PARUN
MIGVFESSGRYCWISSVPSFIKRNITFPTAYPRLRTTLIAMFFRCYFIVHTCAITPEGNYPLVRLICSGYKVCRCIYVARDGFEISKKLTSGVAVTVTRQKRAIKHSAVDHNDMRAYVLFIVTE